MTSFSPKGNASTFVPDSPAAWRRLLIALAIATVGSVGLWAVVVVLPKVQAELGGTRGGASLAYTLAMVGFGLGGVATGRLSDKMGIIPGMWAGVLCLLLGCCGAGLSGSLWQFAVAHLFVGLGASVTFAPLMAEASRWFVRRRGIAVGIAASGYYLSGAIWPASIQRSITEHGWRATYFAMGILCGTVMALLVMALRSGINRTQKGSDRLPGPIGVDVDLNVNALTVILSVASFSCCTAMAIPQVHIVAYCSDLGFGVARGAEMLSLMLAFGIVSRIGSGFVADRIGGLATLLIGSLAQSSSLVLYLFFDDLTSLYVVSALFGLFQGGIVPSYAIIVRETMPAREAATRVGIVIMVSLIGMSFGGWISGVIFDRTRSYDIAFLNGIAWNVLNIAIVLLLLLRSRRRVAFA